MHFILPRCQRQLNKPLPPSTSVAISGAFIKKRWLYSYEYRVELQTIADSSAATMYGYLGNRKQHRDVITHATVQYMVVEGQMESIRTAGWNRTEQRGTAGSTDVGQLTEAILAKQSYSLISHGGMDWRIILWHGGHSSSWATYEFGGKATLEPLPLS